MNKISKTIQFGDKQIVIETGHIARQATAAVMVSQEGTQVLVTAVARPKAKADADFFPLTVNYQEKMYAAGRIPGGFLKREGRPSDRETLTSRLIDRPIRPLFPKGFYNEIQVVATVMSHNPEVQPDILAMIGASAALSLSGVPFQGPMGAVRVGYREGMYLINPTNTELADSKLDLVVAGTKDAVLMVESEAAELSEEVMLGAVTYGHEMMQSIVSTIEALAKETGKAKWDWSPAEKDTSLVDQVKQQAAQDITAAYQVADKQARQDKIAEIKDRLISTLVNEEASITEDAVLSAFSDLEKNIVRERVLTGEPRIDGRDRKTVRPIYIEPGILERAHGSVLFTRGETQAIVAATLGTERDAQIHDSIHGEQKDHYTLHYNFPPYCVGETGMMGSPKRREIGHGTLARRATEWAVPSQAEFPYSVRIVSEITESNGSSSMASVCGASLAMMDAGVPIKAPVAGIAMGLVKEGERYAVLTDILGDEDHLGDMDFKVAGTAEGVTALQMDIKITGITENIMQEALEQAHEARQHILGLMNKAIASPRETMSEFAPKIITMKVVQDKIKDVIGKGGATIRSLTDGKDVSVDIDEDGTIRIYSSSSALADETKSQIELLTAEVEVGKIYEGKVSRIVDFGAFVNLLPGKDGLVHISQISHDRVENINDYLKEGDMAKVKVLDVDRQGKVKLSIKALTEKPVKEENSSSEGAVDEVDGNKAQEA